MKDDTDLVQKLLAHDEDVPVPPDHERQIRAGLAHLLGGPPTPPGGGGGGNGGGGGSPAPPASPLGKWLATTAIVAGAAAGGGFLAGRSTAPVANVPPPSSTPVAATPPAPSPTPCAQDTAPPPKPSASVAAKPAASSSSASGTSAHDAFDKEQSLLERARSALVRHDAVAAEQALDECERQFPRSRHGEERDYLRIQVTREKGDVDKTRALAKAFLTKYPQSLLASRVEQLAQ